MEMEKSFAERDKIVIRARKFTTNITNKRKNEELSLRRKDAEEDFNNSVNKQLTTKSNLLCS